MIIVIMIHNVKCQYTARCKCLFYREQNNVNMCLYLKDLGQQGVITLLQQSYKSALRAYDSACERRRCGLREIAASF